MIGASELFGLLADDVRRRLLLLLYEEESLHVPDALRERGGVTQSAGSGGGVTAQSPEGLETRLYHVHLPKLVDAEVVEWDRTAGTVSRGRRFEEIEPLLELLSENAAQVPQRVF